MDASRHFVAPCGASMRENIENTGRLAAAPLTMAITREGTSPLVADTAETIRAAFARLGLRDTRPRRLLAERLAQLAAAGQDFSAEELWHDVQHVEPRLGRATVFRTLETLLGQGLLDRIEFADGTHRFRLCGGEHHHHLTCTACHRVVEVDACLPREVFTSIAEQTGFRLEGHSLEIFGRCVACRNVTPNPSP